MTGFGASPRRRKGGDHTLAALKSIRTARPVREQDPGHQDYLTWRNANARYPDVLAAQRRERARIRSKRRQRWGRPRPKAA